jgi:hypothetical protein
LLILKFNKIQMQFFHQILLTIVFNCLALNGFSQVGINTVMPLSTLDINGNLSVKTLTLIGSSSVTSISDGVYLSLSPQATDQEFQLPSPITYPGRVYIVRNISNTNTAKLTTIAGNFFFKGYTTGGVNTIYMYDNHYRTMIIISDGSNWTIYDN